MPHTTRQTKQAAPSKKVLRKRANRNLFMFWFKNWEDNEFPGAQEEDGVFYEGAFDQCCTENGDFIRKKLLPGIKKKYVILEDEDGEDLTEIPDDDDLDQEVVIRFNPEKIINKMHHYFPRSVLKQHYTALKECGWDVDNEWENGKRNVYRS